PSFSDLEAIDASPVRAFDKASEDAMVEEIKAAKKSGDTLGGIVEDVAKGLPIGLGPHTYDDARLDAQLASAVMGYKPSRGSRSATDSRRRVGAAPKPTMRWCVRTGRSPA